MSDYEKYMVLKEVIKLAGAVQQAFAITSKFGDFPRPHAQFFALLSEYVDDKLEEQQHLTKKHGVRITDDKRILYEGSKGAKYCVIFDDSPKQVQQILGLEHNLLQHNVGIDPEVAKTIDSSLNGHFRAGREVDGQLYLFTNHAAIAHGYAEFYLKCKSEGITQDFDRLAESE
jgi:hypothetical protein